MSSPLGYWVIIQFVPSTVAPWLLVTVMRNSDFRFASRFLQGLSINVLGCFFVCLFFNGVHFLELMHSCILIENPVLSAESKLV